jgi:hypothetical protein
MNETIDEHDEFYEYFNRRPVALTFVVIFGSIVSAIEVATNAVILVIKLKRSSEKTGFDMLIVNLAIMFIINACLLIQFLIEEIFYDFANDTLCNSFEFFSKFSMTSVVFSVLALVIVSKIEPRIAVKKALIIVGVIYIASILDAIPYTLIKAVPDRLKDGTIRNICSYPDSFEKFLIWRSNYVKMTVIELAIPSVLFAIAAVFSIFVTTSKSSGENRNMLMHSVIIGTCYILIQVPTKVLEILGFYYYEVNFGYAVTLKFLLPFVGIMNIALYCHFNKLFYKQLCQFFSFLKANNNRELVNEFE